MRSNTVNGMRRYAPLAAVVIVSLLLGDAVASLESGQTKFLRGDYDGAIKDLGKVKGRDRGPARLMLARVYIQTGKYAEAEKEATDLTTGGTVENDAKVLLAEIYRLTGRYTEARDLLEPLAAKHADLFRARYVLGLVYRDLGEMTKAHETFQSFYDDFRQRRIDEDDPYQNFYVAEAARYSSDIEDANDWFRDAVHLDPNLFSANIEWGYMFLAKYHSGLAEASFDDVLKIDPNHPEAHNGMALVKLDQSYDLAGANHHLDQALATNPSHVPSLLTRASMEIDQNEWDAAKATLEQVFAVNPLSFEGRALLATVHWLRDDTKAYEAEKKTVFDANPAYAEFFHIIARSAVREHRYKQAIELEKEAIKVNPTYYEAMEAAGTGHLRLGEEKEGLEWLEKSWEGDQYNARTKNILDLWDATIPNEYSFVRSKSFKFRFPNDEKDILRRYIEPAMEQAFAEMSARYGFTPKTPLIMELFSDPDDYSVRTVGLPNLGALGVCFGQVVTAMSPSNGDINWGMVLWHELAHVFAIQLSDSRVPRWFTEGLSEYETLIARPEWRRENDADLYGAVMDGTLPSVADLNENFMKPSMQSVIVAYYLSSVTIEFIVANWGFDAIVDALKLFAKGHETPEVIEKITGKKVAEFDEAFRAYLAIRLAPYDGTFRVPTEGFDDITALQVAVDADPKNPDVHANLGLGLFFNADVNAAWTAAEKAIELDPKHKLATYLLAELSIQKQDFGAAETHYKKLIANGADSFDVRGRMALLAKHQNKLDEAEKQLCAAKALDPERSYPYIELYEIYDQQGKKDKALAELETYVMLEQMQYAPIKQLVLDHAEQKSWNKVVTYGEMAVFINPFDADMFVTLGDGYLETGDPDKALYTYDSALTTKPEIRRPALANIGRARAFAALGKKRQAIGAIKKALKAEPENADALKVRKKLTGK